MSDKPGRIAIDDFLETVEWLHEERLEESGEELYTADELAALALDGCSLRGIGVASPATRTRASWMSITRCSPSCGARTGSRECCVSAA
jgi:hypothetical protein